MNTFHRKIGSRVLRGSICALVVLAQLVGAFGWAASAAVAIHQNGSCGNRPCGCTVVDEAACCCCDAPVAPTVPDCCKPGNSCCESTPKRSCCEKPKPPAPPTTPIPVTKSKGWLAALLAQPCHSKTQPNAVAGEPEISQTVMAAAVVSQEPAGLLLPHRDFFVAPLLDPPIPPPRLG